MSPYVPETHKVIRWHPPAYDVRVETIQAPRIEHPDDVIVKVSLGALCGSDLHIYRGHGGVDKVHTCGHEFIGEVVAIGESYGRPSPGRPALYSSLKVGDRVVSPFTVNCGECDVCRLGYTARCPHGALFGSPVLEGGQAQYVRVPKAGGTLFNLSDPSTWSSGLSAEERKQALTRLSDSSLLLLADILPTGVFAALQAINHPKVAPVITGKPWPLCFNPETANSGEVSSMTEEDRVFTVAVVGLGPVGICATVSMLDVLATRKIRYRMVAVDPLESRRKKAEAVYAAIDEKGKGNGEFVALSIDDAKEKVKHWTNGVGCTAVLEVVGNSSALTLAYEIVRAFGVITTVGVHGAYPVPYEGRQMYNKNVSIDFGRCPSRAMFPPAFDLLVKRQDVFGGVGEAASLIDRVVEFDEAPEIYRKFDKGEIGKPFEGGQDILRRGPRTQGMFGVALAELDLGTQRGVALTVAPMEDPSLARSRAGSISRASTPGIARSPPSRLAPPSLRPSPSLSNLNVQCHNALAVPQQMAQPQPRRSGDHVLDSSASSVIDVDTAEGMLIQDIDAEADQTDTEDIRSLDQRPPITTEGSKQLLRDQLRKTLSTRSTHTESSRPHQKEKTQSGEDLAFNGVSRYPPREYFVLTDAGKPVYISRPEGEDQDNMASTIGIMQALISVFIDDNDKLRSINAGKTRITFLQRPPLYYVCVSSWGEPESVTRTHLEYLHLQILSIVSGGQLKRIFERRTNFDLRRLLNGAEPFMNTLLTRLEHDLAMTMSALHCLKLDLGLRKRIADALVPASRMKDMLYIMLVANNQVVTLVRPRKHSIHPADLHIIMNTLHSPSIVNSLASASWLPVCLPKLNSAGFTNVYISFVRKDDNVPRSATGSTPQSTQDSDRASNDSSPSDEYLDESGVAFVCVTGNADFDSIRTWSESVIQRLSTEGTLAALLNAHHQKQTVYSVSELGIPGLRHFVYKSRAQMQITLPTYEDPYDQSQARKRLTTLYQILHDSINAKSGQEAGLKMQYIRTETECVMGWITQPFELYLSISPLIPKSAAIGAANAVFRWVKKEEARLFLRDAPVF